MCCKISILLWSISMVAEFLWAGINFYISHFHSNPVIVHEKTQDFLRCKDLSLSIISCRVYPIFKFNFSQQFQVSQHKLAFTVLRWQSFRFWKVTCVIEREKMGLALFNFQWSHLEMDKSRMLAWWPDHWPTVFAVRASKRRTTPSRPAATSKWLSFGCHNVLTIPAPISSVARPTCEGMSQNVTWPPRVAVTARLSVVSGQKLAASTELSVSSESSPVPIQDSVAST